MSRNRIIAFILHDFSSEIADNMWNGLVNSLKSKNMNVISISGGRLYDQDPKERIKNIIYDQIKPEYFDGFVIWSTNIFLNLKEEEIYNFLNRFKGKPVLLLQQKIKGYPAIIHEVTSGIINILDHLTEKHNYKKIGFVKGPENHPLSHARYETFINYLKNKNLEINEDLISPWGSWSEITGVSYVNQILDKKIIIGKDIQAIVCSNTNQARGIIKELKKRGYSLPRDIAITGYNDNKEAELIIPSITLADPGFYHMGYLAGEIILKLIEGKEIKEDFIVDSKLIIRNSCGCIEERISKILNRENRSKILNIIESEKKDYNFYDFKNEIKSICSKEISDFITEKLFVFFTELTERIKKENLFDSEFHFLTKDIIENLNNEGISLEKQEILLYKLFIKNIINISTKEEILNLYEMMYYFFNLSKYYQINKLEYEELLNERSNLDFNNLGIQLLTSYGLDNLATTIINNFQKLKSDYICIFINEKKDFKKLSLLLAINNEGVSKKGKMIKSNEIFNKEFLPKGKPFHAIALPLTYLDEFLGILIIKSSFSSPLIYLQLQAQLNSAIKNTFLAREREKLIKDIKVKNRRLNMALKAIYGEMELTKKIQMNILPKEYNLTGYEVYGYMKPAKEIGGDYYDIISLDKDNYWVNIGDVAGHGIDAGMIVLMLQTAVITQLFSNKEITPKKLTNEINKVIYYNCRNRLQKESYITNCFLKFNKNGEFLYAGAHLEILIYRKKIKEVEIKETNGFWLGILPDIQDFTKEYNFILETGDVLLLFTDGITEATNKERELYGLERLINFLRKNGENEVRTIAKNLIYEIENFQHEQVDDYTFVIIKKL